MNRLFFLFCLLAAFSARTFAADKPNTDKAAPAKTSEANSTTPKNTTGDRKFESAIAAIEMDGGLPKITLKNGAMTLGLKPETEIVREERGLLSSDLKIGDTLCLVAMKGQRSKMSIKEKTTVTGLKPIIITIGDSATLTLLKADQWEFDRATSMQAADLKAGQTIAVQISLKRDGDIIAKRVAVVTGKPQPKPKAPKPAAKTTVAGNN